MSAFLWSHIFWKPLVINHFRAHILMEWYLRTINRDAGHWIIYSNTKCLTVVLLEYSLSWCVYETQSAWLYESVKAGNKLEADTHHFLLGSGRDEDQVSSIGLGHLQQLLFGRVREQSAERGFQWTICPYWSHAHLLYDTRRKHSNDHPFPPPAHIQFPLTA